uniref:Uncharacterized protein n=1 Tax=Tanacetum cinerariifolium TaxID=118510 RepID=A0A6L2NUZ5_TANCI|nr:hypothetical protein [Tanacetum cinerariifolium]
MVGDLEDKGVASIVTSSTSSRTIPKHLLSSADSFSSSIFCFLDLSWSRSSPALFELLSIDIPRSGESCSLCRGAGKRTYTMSEWGCFRLEHPEGQAGNFILPYIVELQCHELRDEEQDEDDDDKEEEHSASADSIPPPPALRVTASITPYPPIPLPTASPPLQLLLSDHRADGPEVTLPPQKRLSIVHCSRYEAGESSAVAAARPIEGRRADYGFVGSAEAEIRRWIAEDIGYGVNTRVTELAAVQEQDTQDIYRVMEDAQGRQTEIFQRVEALVDDSQYHYETGRLVDQEARCEIQVLQAREQARAGAPEGAGSSTGDNDDDESSNDDDHDDDVEKDEEDKEEEEHLAPADPSDVSTDDLVP